MSKTIELRKRLTIPPKIQAVIEEFADDGIIEDWEWLELETLCRQENINPRRVRRHLELQGLLFKLPIEVKASLDNNIIRLSMSACIKIDMLTIWIIPSNSTQILEAVQLSNLRSNQPLPDVQLPLITNTTTGFDVLFKAEFSNQVLWLSNQNTIPLINQDGTIELTTENNQLLYLVCVEEQNAESKLQQYDLIRSMKQLEESTPAAPVSNDNTPQPIEPQDEPQTYASITSEDSSDKPQPKQTLKHKNKSIVTQATVGLLVVSLLGYFGYSFLVSKNAESMAYDYLLQTSSAEHLSSLNNLLEDSKGLYETDSLRNLRELKNMMQLDENGISGPEIVDMVRQNITDSPLGQYTLGYAYNLACRDGKLNYCNDSLALFTNLVTSPQPLKTAAILQYADALGFSNRITNATQYSDSILENFCASIDTTNVTMESLSSVVRCNAYRSDQVTIFEIPEWKTTLQRQVNMMKQSGFDDKLIMSFLWGSGSLQCLQVSLKKNKDYYLPNYSWSKSPEIGYCYYLGLLALDCPIKASQVREYGQILMPNKLWQEHFIDSTANMSNQCQMRSRPRDQEEWDLFYYTTTTPLSLRETVYQLDMQPEGTFTIEVHCTHYKSSRLTGFWSWNDFDKSNQKGTLDLHIVKKDSLQIYNFEKDSDFKFSVDISKGSKRLSLSGQTLKKITKLGCY